MQHSLSKADCHQDGYWRDANSSKNPRGRTPSPRQGGQLADYYPLIAEAVNRYQQNTAETRRTIYDRARAAMVVKLRSLTPPLGELDISCEQLALEKAIRKVETESLRRSPTPPHQPTPRIERTPEPAAETSDFQPEIGNAVRTCPSMVILTNDDDQAGNNLAFAKKLADSPDLSTELQILQKEIRRNRRGSLTILPERKLVPLTIMGLFILSVTVSGAY
jgi:hypothetical protein